MQEFSSSLSRLKQQSIIEYSYFFIDDNQDEQASELLRHFAKVIKRVTVKRSGRQNEYIRNETTHYWNNAIDERYDHLFLVDSVLFLHPCTAKQLAATEFRKLSVQNGNSTLIRSPKYGFVTSTRNGNNQEARR
ncbi:hypothetical protein JI735_34585 (plasmid) [Paenibacillus sonchi]|uniref:Uncharacterized protein n=1 Tax=Paenibacillus sonchi TaxID=373687 RepID=A0A974PIH6_9BACL|nr:hypothetical protein [Paenibacillus sonchi]QQZ64562.1 hypothetical protein JI735_34585 [Paenibacillus sonchi]